MQILEAAAYISFIAGAAFAVWQLHEIRQDRRTQLVLNMMDMLSSREVMELKNKIWRSEFKDGKEAEEKCGEVVLTAVANYYEGLGYLVGRGLIDREAVFEVLSIAVWWDKMKPWIMSEFGRGGNPSVYEHFERAAAMERLRESKKRRKGV